MVLRTNTQDNLKKYAAFSHTKVGEILAAAMAGWPAGRECGAADGFSRERCEVVRRTIKYHPPIPLRKGHTEYSKPSL